MRNTERKEILALLAQVSVLAPDIRFGQLIANLSYLAIGPTTEAIWDMEDAELLAALKQHLADLWQRTAEVVEVDNDMPNVHETRAAVQKMRRAIPFQPFALSLENGDRVIIEHPENIAFDPMDRGEGVHSQQFYVISRKIRLFSTFHAVTSVALVDHGAE